MNGGHRGRSVEAANNEWKRRKVGCRERFTLHEVASAVGESQGRRSRHVADGPGVAASMRICGVVARDVLDELTAVGMQGGRNQDRGQIRAAPPE